MEDQIAKQAYTGGIAAGAINGGILTINASTIRQNIDRKIAFAEAQVERLKATKAKMESSNLLDLPISDLREAMNY